MEETYPVTDRAWLVNGLARKMMDASPDALDIIEAVLAGKMSEGVNRPRIDGLFEAVRLYTVSVALPEDMCDLCFGKRELRSGVGCHRCNGTGIKPTPDKPCGGDAE